jgi:hypothetical protein
MEWELLISQTFIAEDQKVIPLTHKMSAIVSLVDNNSLNFRTIGFMIVAPPRNFRQECAATAGF